MFEIFTLGKLRTCIAVRRGMRLKTGPGAVNSRDFFEGPGGVREGYEAEKWSGRGRGPGGVDETQIYTLPKDSKQTTLKISFF